VFTDLREVGVITKGIALQATLTFQFVSLALLLAALVMGIASPARAQADYPNRPVQLIIAYSAGTIGDVSMRILAEKLVPCRRRKCFQGYAIGALGSLL
jgi:hypothetical protein